MTKAMTSFLPHRIVAPKQALAEHHDANDAGVLDPNRFLKAVMAPYDWENVFPGIRTTMSRWEYCVLHYFADNFHETAWPNVLHNLSRTMRGVHENKMYRHTSLGYTRIGLGPGSRSNLRRNSQDYPAMFRNYYGSFSQDELSIGERHVPALKRFAKALCQHGRNGHRVLEKGSRSYSRIRRKAAQAMWQALGSLAHAREHRPPLALRNKLPTEPQRFTDDLEVILRHRGAHRDHPAFWRLALASAATKVLYGFKFTDEEGTGAIEKTFAQRVLKFLQLLRRHNRSPELIDAIEVIRGSLARGHSHYKPPLQHVYNVGDRKLIIQNFRFPTWLKLCRQVQSAARDRL